MSAWDAEAAAVTTVRALRTPEAMGGVSDDLVPIVFSPIYQPVVGALRAAYAAGQQHKQEMLDKKPRCGYVVLLFPEHILWKNTIYASEEAAWDDITLGGDIPANRDDYEILVCEVQEGV